jgi:adenine-specific DNA-methyltransferase
VDFRLKDYLRVMPDEGCVPLLYPAHFSGHMIEWPKPEARKPNALKRTPETQKWLMPDGCYAVVRRFSSKEEKRRIVAALVSSGLAGAPYLAFENHLNVFHQAKQGLQADLARGLVSYLNSEMVDTYFRHFSGHTQVNATDLRTMRYPSRDALIQLGRWTSRKAPPQAEIERRIRNLT